MKYVVDASTLNEFLKANALNELFSLNISLACTNLVVSELENYWPALVETLNGYDLKVVELSMDDLLYSKSKYDYGALSIQDRTCLWLANKLSLSLLTSDGAMRKIATKLGIAVHGSLWILDNLMKEEIIDRHRACEIIRIFERSTIRMPESEMIRRIEEWCS